MENLQSHKNILKKHKSGVPGHMMNDNGLDENDDDSIMKKNATIEIQVQQIDGQRPDSDDESSFEDSDDENDKQNHLHPEEKKNNNISPKGSAHSKRSKFSTNRGKAKMVDEMANYA